jgi:hypothetical protein
MMVDVPWGVEGPNSRHGTGLSGTPPSELIPGNGDHLTPEAVMLLTKRAASRGHQPFRVGHVGRPVFMDVDRQLRQHLSQVTGRPGVVQVHVGEEEVSEIGGVQPGPPDPLQQGLQRGGRARVHQGGLRGFQEVAADGARGFQVMEVQGGYA